MHTKYIEAPVSALAIVFLFVMNLGASAQETYSNVSSDHPNESNTYLVEPKSSTPWGDWNEAAFCPRHYYVCGIAQRVEAPIGDGDDSAMNGLRFYCCQLPQ